MKKMPDLLINNLDIYAAYKVRMGDGFLDALTEPLSLKDNIENESRLEHGKRVIMDNPKIASREVLLEFTISGNTPSEFISNKNGFLKLLYTGMVEIQVPKVDDNIYRLIYRSKGADYGMNIQRTFCHLILKFEEPNPNDRS